MFKNYWPTSDTSLYNETVVRVLLGAYIIWKLLYLPTWNLMAYPAFTDQYQSLLPPVAFHSLVVFQVIGLVLAVAFILHYKFQYASIGLGAVVSYIALLAVPRTYPGTLGNYQSLFLAALFVFLYGVYHRGTYTPPRTVWRLLSPTTSPIRDDAPTADEQSPSRDSPLSWFLMVIALTYFGSGFQKLVKNGTDWMRGESFGDFIIHTHSLVGYHHPLAEFVLHQPVLMTIGAEFALALQVGFIASIYTDKLYDWFVVGLIIFHVAAAVILSPVFFDQIIFLLFFIDWDTVSLADLTQWRAQ